MDRVNQSEIDAEAQNRAVAASKQAPIGNHSTEVEKSLKTAEIESAAEHYQERAADIEFDGRLQRVTAEAMARREVSEKWGKDVAKEATK